jgi:hypothetical protein
VSPCGFIIGRGGSDANLIRLGWLWRFGKFSPHPYEGKANNKSSARAEARTNASVGQGHGATASVCGRRSVPSPAAAKSVASSRPCRTQPTRRLTIPSSGRAKGCALVPPLKSNVRALSLLRVTLHSLFAASEGSVLPARSWSRCSSRLGDVRAKLASVGARKVLAGPTQERRAGLQVGSGASFARAATVVALGKQALLEGLKLKALIHWFASYWRRSERSNTIQTQDCGAH